MQRKNAFENTVKDEKMGFLKHLLEYLIWPIRRYRHRQAMKQRLKELRAKDPFIYK